MDVMTSLILLPESGNSSADIPLALSASLPFL